MFVCVSQIQKRTKGARECVWGGGYVLYLGAPHQKKQDGEDVREGGGGGKQIKDRLLGVFLMDLFPPKEPFGCRPNENLEKKKKKIGPIKRTLCIHFPLGVLWLSPTLVINAKRLNAIPRGNR